MKSGMTVCRAKAGSGTSENDSSSLRGEETSRKPKGSAGLVKGWVREDKLLEQGTEVVRPNVTQFRTLRNKKAQRKSVL